MGLPLGFARFLISLFQRLTFGNCGPEMDDVYLINDIMTCNLEANINDTS